MSNERNTSITFIFTAEPNQVAEGERLCASHAASEWPELVAAGARRREVE